ncbi:MAG: DUF3857 domain-containing protein [Sphingobacteriaceae bacterium]|nr:MAG: DUF3857 domain-containing protein [Sphingobacteriaceae bacterium]
MKKLLTLFLFFALCSSFAFSQTAQYNNKSAFSSPELSEDFPYGKRAQDQVDMKSFNSDTSVHALGLNEYAKAFFVSNTYNHPIQFEYHARVKIFDEAGFKHGTVEIPLYNDGKNSFEKLIDIKGITFYTDDAGKPQYTQLASGQVKTITIDENRKVVRFTLPSLKKGCVIEYKYVTESPYIDNFKTWYFQSTIPKLHSTFYAIIPKFFGYDVAMSGNLQLTRTDGAEESNCFYLNSVGSDCVKALYGMDNIPAIPEEPFMPSLKDKISALYFQLTDMTVVSNFADRNYGVRKDIGKEWKDFDKVLKNHDDLGSVLTKKSPFKNDIVKITAGKTTALDKAIAIYKYIQQGYRWNAINSIYSKDGIKKSFDKHTGSSGDINLGLISALNSAGIPTNAVLLSTRDNGVVSEEIPNIASLNYVIAKTIIDGKTYFLDATERALDFGQLPLRTNNGKGRELSFNGESVWTVIPPTQSTKNIYDVDLTLQANNTLKGTVTHIAEGYAAYEKRKQIKAYATEAAYIDSVRINNKNLKIASVQLSGIDDTALPVKETYTIELPLPANGAVNIAELIPVKLLNNPFWKADRKYIVDLGTTIAQDLNVTINLPAGYAIEKVPAALNEGLPNNAGKLDVAAQIEDGKFTYTQKFAVNKPVFSQQEYPFLKAQYDKMSQSQNAAFELVKKTGTNP